MTELTFPIRGVTYTFDVSLVSQANPLVFQNAPTIVAGDVLISIDGGATAPITNLPVVAGKIVTVTLTAAEMTGDRISVLFSDVAGAQWCDLLVDLLPSSITLDDIPTSSEIWGYSVRTLTNYSNLFTGNNVLENYVEVLRGDDWGFSFSGLGDITGNLKLWFTIKNDDRLADTGAMVQIERTAGLLIVNGGTGIPADGSIVVTDPIAGNITITLDSNSSRLTVPGNYKYDIQVLTALGIIRTVVIGTITIRGDVTRAIV
jgi:hypothetical protein